MWLPLSQLHEAPLPKVTGKVLWPQTCIAKVIKGLWNSCHAFCSACFSSMRSGWILDSRFYGSWTLPRKGVVRWTQIPKHHVTWIESVERVCNLCRFVFFCVPSTCGEAVHHQLRDLGTRWSYAVLVVQSVWIQQTLVGTAPLADLVWMGDWRLFALVNFKCSLIVAHMHLSI